MCLQVLNNVCFECPSVNCLIFLLLSFPAEVLVLSVRPSHPADLPLKQHAWPCADTASIILAFLHPTQFLRPGVKVTVRIFPLPAGVKWLSCPTECCRLQFYRGPFISRLMVWMAYEILLAAWDRSFPSRLLLSHRNWFATSCWKNYIRPYSCSKIQSFCSKTTRVAYKDCI